MPPLLRLLRPHQYAKNVLVFAAPGAAGRLDEAAVLATTLFAFVLFCAVSSAGYVTNDLLDAEADRMHPVKKSRPIANGQVSEQQARVIIAALAVTSVALSFLLGWKFALVLASYGALTTAYSTYLKRIPWIELIVVSAGFLLRAVAGGAAIDAPISAWFLVVVSAGALLMITGKRLGELMSLGSGSASRAVLAGYGEARLRQILFVAAALAVGGYVTWAAAEASDQAPDSLGSLLLRLSAVPFAIAIGRYLVLCWRGDGETPESLVARDKLMVVAGIAWTVIYAIGRYL